MRTRENEPPLPEPLAYFITWSTYGTWLPGDERGWVEFRHGWRLPDSARKLEAAARMTEDVCLLDCEQRRTVEEQIKETCQIRGWHLHAVNCRSSHLHLVVTARIKPERVHSQLKAWCTRALKEHEATRSVIGSRPDMRENWWAERGSQRYVNDEDGLEASILYVRDAQDRPLPRDEFESKKHSLFAGRPR